MWWDFLNTPLVLVLLGFILGKVPEFFGRRSRIGAHWQALGAQAELCKEKSETLVNDNVQSPLYRLPLSAFSVSFPVLLADGTLSEDDTRTVTQYFGRAEEINRGLDNAAAAQQQRRHNDLLVEYSRNLEKARSLISDLYPQVASVIRSHTS